MSTEYIPIAAARTQLAELVDRVAFQGQRVVVTRHGRARVAIITAADLERLESLEAAQNPTEPD